MSIFTASFFFFFRISHLMGNAEEEEVVAIFFALNGLVLPPETDAFFFSPSAELHK